MRIAVIGAGVVGATRAWQLAEADRAVEIARLETETPWA